MSRKRHWRSEKGVSLIEIIVSLALLGIAATGLSAGLATGLRINLVIESQTVSASAVTAQLEDTLFQTYVEPADYPAVSVPEGFSLAFDNFVIVPTLLERITVAVSDAVKELFRITTHKVNTEFSASPPNLLLVQRDYRWFDNTDALPPVTAFADENTPFTVITTGQVFRLRMSVEASDLPLDAGTQSFKLQFAKDSSGPWSDVGNVASTTPAWRGFDNPSLADGQTSTSVLLGKSIAFQSYEEENPSVPNPILIPTGVEQWTEWDWVVQENGAAFNTNYLFRMVRADGSPLESYTRFPVLVMPPPVTFTQSDYRWFENADALAPGPALAAELTPFSTTTHGLTYRLRMNVEVDGLNLSAGFQVFRLQFSTSTAGGFSDVGDVGSAAEWRGFNNPSVADGAAGGTALLSTSDVFESYEEQNPSVANPVAINIEERGEWDWVIQDNGAADDTTYFFRMVRAVGTPLDAYSFFPELTTAPAVVLDQKDFRWFSNLDDATPVDPLASENVALSAADPLVILRLRMNVESNGANVAAGSRAFKLQYATSTAGLWTDLGAPSSTSTTFVGFDNPSVADGVALPSLKLTSSTVAQSYEEANPSIPVPQALNDGERSEWDWVVRNNAAPPATNFVFRMVNQDGTPLEAYTRFPRITTAAGGLTQQDYQWFENRNHPEPLVPLVAEPSENTPGTNIQPLTVVRLRINAAAAGDAVAAGEITLRLQYATSTGGVWRDLGAPGSAEIWRGFDNSLVDDGNAISIQLLDSTNVLETYEENNPSLSNPNAIPLGDRAEWDWVVQNNSAPTDTYVFRMIRDNGELLDGYVNFPKLTTVEPALVQRDFQWYPSSSVLNPATSTALAPVNGAATGAVPGAAFRIRMNVEASGFDLPATARSFNLQFANTTTGPWTDVGLLGSEGIWRGSDNAGLSDGATVSPILPSSDVGESYEEENPSVLNPNEILATTTQRGEWDWAIEDRLAPSGTFFFRMVREDGTTLDDYTNFPEIDAAGPSLAQEDYRWFANLDSIAPGSALAGENTLFTATEHVDAYRLRMNVEVANSALFAGAQSFKLQYATSTPGPWSDVGAVGSNNDWWGFDNPSPADGSLITTVLASSTVAATYEEFNPSVPNPNPVGAGDRAEWDWVLQPALVDSETTYYFRMVRAGGETLEVYTLFPSLTTPKALVLTQQDYRWFANTSTTTTPFVALAGENTSTTGAVPGDVFRLRINVNVAGADMGAGSQAFKLQFTTSTAAPAGPWTDVGALPPLQIGLDAVSSNSAGGGANTLTISHTVGSQPNRVLVVGAEGEDNSSTDCVATGVTYGGVALTNVAEAVAGTSPFMCVSLWYLVAPATGTADVVITWAGNVRRRNGGAISIFNAAQQGPEAQNSQALNAATTISTSINTVTEGTWVIDAVGGGTGTAFTPLAPNQIEQYDIQEGSSRGAGSTKHVPTAGPTAMSWTKTGNYLAHVVAAFAPFAEEQTFTEIWRGFDNPSLDDGETLTSSTLAGTTVVQSYEEVNPSVPNPNPAVATTTERAEWDWVVQHNGAPAGSYVFRMVRDNGVPLNTYVNFPEIESAPPDFIQHDYRWFANVDGAATTTGWETQADTPSNVRFGGAMTTDGTDLYALRGAGSSDFWRYDISAGNWVPLTNTPGTVSQGGAVEFAGDHVYALRGGSTQDFWRYDILGDTWEVRAATPANVDWGGSLAWDGGDSIYALRGDVSTAFWVYSISGNSWASLAGTLANVSNGGSLAYVTGDLYALRGDNTTDFWKYTTSTDTWSALTSTPAVAHNGGSLAWDREHSTFMHYGATRALLSGATAHLLIPGRYSPTRQ